MKYYRDIGLGDSVGRNMVEFLSSQNWNVDLLTPVPTGRKRLKERGYNQVDRVARCIAYESGIEYLPNALKKIRETRSQVGLNGPQRRENVSKAYQADPSAVKRKSILLMDDVATTGSTISACTDALLSADATEVYALTIARALAHHDLNRV